MPDLVIKYDGEAVFEGTIKDGKTELDFKSGFDALAREVDSDGEEAIFNLIQRFVKDWDGKYGMDMDEYVELIKSADLKGLAGLAATMMGRKKEEQNKEDEQV